MKKVLTLATIVVAFVACKQQNPVTEETKKQMETFESDWKKTGDDIVSWKSELDATTTEIKTMSDTAINFATGKVGMDTAIEMCKMHSADADKIQANYAEALTSWEADSKAYADWKATLDKGEVKAEDVTTAINDFTAKLNTYKGNLETWKTSLSNLKDACKANCDEMEKASDKKM